MGYKTVVCLISSLILSGCAAVTNQNDSNLNDYNQLCVNSKGSLKAGDIAVVQDTQPFWIADTGTIYSEAEYARKKVNPLQSITSSIMGSKEQNYKHVQLTVLKDTASGRISCIPTVIGSSLYNTILSRAPVGQKVLIQKASSFLSGAEFYNSDGTYNGFVFAPILR